MLYEITETLKRYLLTAIPDGGDWVENMALRHDESTELNLPTDKLILFLYAVGENPHLRNRGPVATPEGFVRPPMGLSLRYLITYNSAQADQTQKRLARVLQAFFTRPRLGPAELDPTLVTKVDHLLVRLRAVSQEELNQIWTALNLGMRLSLYYEVDAAFIEPSEQETIAPVEERRLDYAGAPTT